MPQLVDPYGRPVDTRALTREEAAPTLTGVRPVLSDHPSRGLTPQRLSAILTEAEEGDATRYLELAEDMEEKDLHYLAQLGTRKRAIAQLGLSVVAASDDAADVAAADLVREVLLEEGLLEAALFDVLDAVGKGYSVCEILWETTAARWRVRELAWRDPRWFAFDPADGTTLRLRDGAGLLPLTPYKYVVHVHAAKSGLPIRGGLARAAAWAYLFKNYALKDWVAFAEVFGQPYRVGKYHASATADERAKLLRAVASIGTDAAAIIPEGMMIEFVEASRGGTIDLYERLAAFLDAQVSKAVLGQTLTSEVGTGGGSRALGEVHNEVRRDIMRSDARQLAATLNAALVRPLVELNLGPRARYPRLVIGLPDELGTLAKIDALTKTVPLGLDVETSAVRDLLGFPEPARDAAVLRGGGQPGAGSAASSARYEVRGADQTATHSAPRTPHAPAAHAAAPPAADAIDELVRGALEDEGWVPLLRPVVEPVAALAQEVGSLEELRERLSELVGRMDVAQLTEMLSRNAFAARLAGGLEVPLSEAGE